MWDRSILIGWLVSLGRSITAETTTAATGATITDVGQGGDHLALLLQRVDGSNIILHRRPFDFWDDLADAVIDWVE